MPRQRRDAPPPRRERAGRTVLGLPWPLPISPVATSLLLALAIVGGLAWWFEGRFETPPAEAAKQLLPYKADEVQAMEVRLPEGTAAFSRGPDGKMTLGGPPPTPTPPPPPDATPGPVTFSPASRAESVVGQLATLRIDRTLPEASIKLSELGLENPKTRLVVRPKTGNELTFAIGELNPEKTSYYVRREERKDTVLVSRYALDDLLTVAREVVIGPATPTPVPTPFPTSTPR
ncbi:MAG TPA: DUF4340 domain-containing protein [Chloroflexota bacterium]|nr:DUF4340 domain-containing protein [Chloroflexota bacterium]